MNVHESTIATIITGPGHNLDFYLYHVMNIYLPNYPLGSIFSFCVFFYKSMTGLVRIFICMTSSTYMTSKEYIRNDYVLIYYVRRWLIPIIDGMSDSVLTGLRFNINTDCYKVLRIRMSHFIWFILSLKKDDLLNLAAAS